MSADRADFFSRLFTKKRPDGPDRRSTAAESSTRSGTSTTQPARTVYKQNLQAIKDHLTKRPHRLPLPKEDLDGIEYVYYNFYWFGPSITYNSSTSGSGGRGNMANYADLMVATDARRASRGATSRAKRRFRFMKDLERAQSARAGRRQLRRPEGAARGRPVRARSRRDRVRVLSLERRAVSRRRTASGTASARTSPRCRSTRRSTFIRSGQRRLRRRRRRAASTTSVDADRDARLRLPSPESSSATPASGTSMMRPDVRSLAGLLVAVGSWPRRPSPAVGRRRGQRDLPARLSDQAVLASDRRRSPNRAARSTPTTSSRTKAGFSSCLPELACAREARRRLPRRRTGAELHLHRGRQAADGVHHRHPARQPARAPAVQGAVRDVRRPRRVSVAAVLARAAGGPRRASRRSSDLFAAFGRRRRRPKRTTARTSRAVDDVADEEAPVAARRTKTSRASTTSTGRRSSPTARTSAID